MYTAGGQAITLEHSSNYTGEAQMSTQVSAMTILLKQLISMLQLQLSQPHILTTIITSKRCQVLYLSITYSMPLNGIYFILSFFINLDRWHISMNAVVLPITKQ